MRKDFFAMEKVGNNIELTVQIPAGATVAIYADKMYNVSSGIHKYKFSIK
jgi:hypothetical protein